MQEAQAQLHPARKALPGYDQRVNAAASQQLDKMSKLMTAESAVLTGHIAAMAADETASVRHMKQKAGTMPAAKGASGGGEDGTGDIIVCDDHVVHYNDPPPSRFWPLLGAVVAATGVVAGAVLGYTALTKKPDPLPSPPPAEVKPAEPPKNTTINQGFSLELIPPKKQ